MADDHHNSKQNSDRGRKPTAGREQPAGRKPTAGREQPAGREPTAGREQPAGREPTAGRNEPETTVPGSSSGPRKNRHIQARGRSGPKPFTESQLQARRSAVPNIAYPEELPVSARRQDIAAAIRDNQVVIVAGETGSGKTTQLPKICLELGRGIGGLIGHTQPRRIAARSVAERISDELGVELGGAIGYQVRFTEEVSDTTLVKLMTDGILLAEIQSDPHLLRYDTIIIDEAHERSLNIDFLLGYLAQLLPRRPDLKLIITSATIDSQRFAEHFGMHQAGGYSGKTAPIIEVSGRTYPVEIRYRPLYDDGTGITSGRDDGAGGDGESWGDDGDGRYAQHTPAADGRERLSRTEEKDQVDGIIDAAQELMAEGHGDILVFLSGEGDINETDRGLKDALGHRYVPAGETSSVPGAVEVLPLFARLSGAEQRRVFQPHQHRRIILATNIAETSLTVPGIHYVIDPGYARISRYSNKTKVQRLPIEPISQASANQRSGRSGRVADGVAIRLYSEEDFESRPEFTEPEIQRTALASVILQMASLGLGDVGEFPFIDPPDMKAVRDGVQQLEEIGALEVDERWRGKGELRLTRIGRDLARLPIDPRLGRMLLASRDQGCASEVLVLVAAMSVQDVRERPAEFKAQSDQLHARFTDTTSDFLAYLNLWRYLRTQQRDLSGSQFRKMCRSEYLHWLRFREWQDVVSQLRSMAKPLGLTLKPIKLPSKGQIAEARNDGKDNSHHQDVTRAVKTVARSADVPAADAIHRSMLVGLLSNIGNWDERKRDYAGARGTHFVIWPGSGLNRRNPDWVMAAELVETSRLFARTVARIKPEWIETVGRHLTTNQYSDPYWSTKHGAAMVHEKVSLYGLTIITDRPVLLSKIGTPNAKETAREIFIRSALVEGQWRTHHAFVKHNKAEIETARDVEERLRVVGLIADDAAQFQFFDERLPHAIVSARHFDTWWKKERLRQPDLLNFTQEFLLGETEADDAAFPAEWIQGDIRLPISYSFNPGKHSDGLTIDIPVTLLPQLKDAGFDWLVPGMRAELITATIRALPKRIRRNLVPAPDVAQQISEIMPEWDDVAHGQPGAPTFREAFSSAVGRLRQIEIDDEAWADVDLPAHLEITFRVRSERGSVLEESTSVTHLQNSLAPQTRSAVESVVKGAVAQALEEARAQIIADDAAAARQQRRDETSRQSQEQDQRARESAAARVNVDTADNLEAWPDLKDDSLPTVVETTGPHGMTVRGYPAFVQVPAGKGAIAGEVSVALRILAEPAEQVRDHRLGVIRLVATEIALPEGRITSRWSGEESLVMAGTPYPSTSALVDDLQLAATRNLSDQWAQQNRLPLGRIRDKRDYEALKVWVRDRLEDEIYRIVRISVRIFSAWSDVESAIKANSSMSLIATVTDVRDQVGRLVYHGFISATPDTQLAQYPRYLQAAVMRIEKATQNPAGDDALAWQVADVEDRLRTEREEFAKETWNAERASELEQARWMIEELRVSLFAQQLGTQGKVSVQRITKVLRGA